MIQFHLINLFGQKFEHRKTNLSTTRTTVTGITNPTRTTNKKAAMTTCTDWLLETSLYAFKAFPFNILKKNSRKTQ